MALKRYEELDFVKAVSIFLVVFCHHQVIPADSVAGNLLMLLAWGAVPCFFMCSGYVLLFREETPGKSLRRVLRIYGIMTVWKVLYLLFYIWQRPVELGTIRLLRYLFLFESIDGVNTGHFWFFQGYILTLLLLPVLTPLFSSRNLKGMLWVTGLCFVSNQLLFSGNFVIEKLAGRLGFGTFELSAVSAALPFTGGCSYILGFFLLGGVLRVLAERKLTQGRRLLAVEVAALLLGLAGLTVLKYIQTGSWFWEGKFLIHGYRWSSTALMACGLFALLSRLGGSAPARWLGKYVGRNTMGIFYLHIPMLYLLSRYVFPLLPLALWVGIAKTLVVVAVASAVTALGKRLPVFRTLLG